MCEYSESRAVWRTSSYSNGSGGDCVEVAPAAPLVAVRDSKDRHGPRLIFTPDEWLSFITGMKTADLDPR